MPNRDTTYFNENWFLVSYPLVSHASGKKHIKTMSSSSSLSLESFREPTQKIIGPEKKKVQQSTQA